MKVVKIARKKAKRRTVTRWRKAKRRVKKGMSGMLAKMVYAGGYGAVRARITGFVRPLADRIPMGAISDELATMGALWAAKKFIGRKVPFVTQLANQGMMIEASQVGQALAIGQVSFGGGASSNNNLWDGGG